MSRIQRFIIALVPRSWAASMEAESRTWMMRCACGHERSVWDAGGIRWKAAGNPRVRQGCAQCGQITWHTIYRREVGPD